MMSKASFISFYSAGDVCALMIGAKEILKPLPVNMMSMKLKWVGSCIFAKNIGYFNQIPFQNSSAQSSIGKRDLVKLASNYAEISLTQKGLSKIKVINLPENGKFPIPKKLE
jgi:hypothetical protein